MGELLFRRVTQSRVWKKQSAKDNVMVKISQGSSRWQIQTWAQRVLKNDIDIRCAFHGYDLSTMARG